LALFYYSILAIQKGVCEMGKTYKPLDDLIANSGLKFGFVAEQMGLSEGRFYKIRLNPKRMNLEQVEKLSNIIGVEPQCLYSSIKNYRKI
jgi:hypothetical protein